MKKPLSPKAINILTIIIGLFLIIVTLIISFEDSSITNAVIVGAGTAFLSTGIINILWMNQTNNKVLKTISDATLESWSAMNKFRVEQSVNIHFFKSSDNKRIIAKIRHEFSYNAENFEKHNCQLSIFSDFRGTNPTENNLKSLDYKPLFFFETIQEDGKDIANWNHCEDCDSCDSYDPPRNKCACKKLVDIRKRLSIPLSGKLTFAKEIDLPKSKSKKSFIFNIHNEYHLCDKLVWSFQEISQNVDITIVKESGCQHIPFYIRINHPAVTEIMSEIDPKYEVNKITGELSTSKSEVVMSIRKKILHYQGFEVYWEVPELN